MHPHCHPPPTPLPPQPPPRTLPVVELAECLFPYSLRDLGLPRRDPWNAYSDTVLAMHPVKSDGWLRAVVAALCGSGMVRSELPGELGARAEEPAARVRGDGGCSLSE